MAYSPPTASGILYNFLGSGYAAPSADALTFSFLYQPSYSQMADIQAAINVYDFKTETYTYVKEKRTYVLGYTGHGVQILKRPTLYGGIRDLGAVLYRQPTHVDLGAYVYAQAFWGDLYAFIRSTIATYSDLSGFIRKIDQSALDLLAAIRRLDSGYADLLGLLHGYALEDLTGYIGTHLPIDLQSVINIIELRDLSAIVTGEYYKGTADLGVEFYKVWLRGTADLGAYIRSRLEENLLPAYVNVIEIRDLPVTIKLFDRKFKNLSAYLSAGQMKNLGARIHGFDFVGLPASLAGVYGPYDLQAYLRVTPHKDLRAITRGVFSGILNLPAFVEGWHTGNITAFISAILAVDLGALLTAVGYTRDLRASIVPRIIKLKKLLQVSLLEHKDLRGLINFQCFGSMYSDLNSYLHTIYKKDLAGTIWGWYGVDGFSDLKAYINAANYAVEDKLSVVSFSQPPKYTLLRLTVDANSADVPGFGYRVFDTLTILLGAYRTANLSAYLNAVMRSVDIGAYLNPILQANYTELPENVYPKSHEVVIDFNDKWRENWRTFVEIMFKRSGPEPFMYFYVSGENKVYRIDRDRHWTIWAKSYLEDNSHIIERHGIRRKFIFDLSKYSTVDEAVRDLIYRVGAYQTSNLMAEIQVITTSNYITDINASITPISVPKTWIKYLRASITGTT